MLEKQVLIRMPSSNNTTVIDEQQWGMVLDLRGALKYREQSSRFLNDTDFLYDSESESLNQKATVMADLIVDQVHFRGFFSWKGLDLGLAARRTLVYESLRWTKSMLIFSRLAQRYPHYSWAVESGNNCWMRILHYVARVYSIRVEIIEAVRLPVVQSHTLTGWAHKLKINLKLLVKRIYGQIDFQKTTNVHARGLLISSAPQFALPFFKSESDFSAVTYFRPELSVLMRKRCDLNKLFHFSLSRFQKSFSDKWKLSKEWRKVADNFFACHPVFQLDGHSVWPAIADDCASILQLEIGEAASYVEPMDRMLQQLKPAVVLVDEDVCPFNKTLVLAARNAGIPSVCLLHGVPFFNIGFYPLSSNYVLAWGENSVTRLARWGVPREQIKICGAVQYSQWKKIDLSARSAARAFLQIKADSALLLVATQPFHDPGDPDFFGSPLSSKAVRDLLLFVKSILEGDLHLQVIIKLHPRDSHSSYTQSIVDSFEKHIYERIRIFQREKINTFLPAVDLTLTTGSTVYFESLLLGIPAILADYSSRRALDFMSSDFVDLENKNREASLRRINLLLHDSENRKKHLLNQDIELGCHFYEKNGKAWELTLAMLQDFSSAVRQGSPQ